MKRINLLAASAIAVLALSLGAQAQQSGGAQAQQSGQTSTPGQTGAQSGQQPAEKMDTTGQGTTGATTGQQALIKVDDQKVTGKTLIVAEVNIPLNGYIVIHSSKDGKPGEVIGNAPVKSGMNKNVSVELLQAPKAGESYMAMLHQDTGATGKFEYSASTPTMDPPLTQAGQPVMDMFKVMQ